MSGSEGIYYHLEGGYWALCMAAAYGACYKVAVSWSLQPGKYLSRLLFRSFSFFPLSQLLSGGFLLLMFTETPAIKSIMSQSGFPIVAWIWPDTINDKWQWACWWVVGRALSPLGQGRAAKLRTLGWWMSKGAAADLEPQIGLTPQRHALAHRLGERPAERGTTRMVALSFL